MVAENINFAKDQLSTLFSSSLKKSEAKAQGRAGDRGKHHHQRDISDPRQTSRKRQDKSPLSKSHKPGNKAKSCELATLT